jgi:hypothetical protein
LGKSNSILLLYCIISLSVALQVSGANWDVIWHGIVNVESFFTPPHAVIYSGVAIALISTIIALTISLREKQEIGRNIMTRLRSIPVPLKLITLGCLIELFSGQFDNWWHSHFGFDGLLSPPHLLLISGMTLSIIGSLYGVRSNKSHTKLNTISLLFGYAVLWMVVINFVFMLTLPFSKGLRFDFNPDPAVALVIGSILLPLFTCLIFMSAIKNINFKFRLTGVTALLMAMQSVSTILSNVYFMPIFPIYLMNLIPALIMDLFVIDKNSEPLKSKNILVASITMSVFVVTLFFPWSINIYKAYFGIDLDTFESVSLFNQLLTTFILPVLIPVSIGASLGGGLFGSKIYAFRETRRDSNEFAKMQ